MTTVGFLHVASSHVAEVRRLLLAQAPWVTDVHLVDPSLREDLLAGVEDRWVRLAARIGELVGRDVEAVVCTCPELLDDVASAARGMGVAALGVEDVPSLAAGHRPAVTA